MIDDLLNHIHTMGKENDSRESERERRMFNITPTTGLFLDLLVRDSRPQRILEIGTSNGYSTIWLGRAAQSVGAVVETIDIDPAKHVLASQNIEAADLASVITLHTVDAGDFLAASEPSCYDFVFLDSNRKQYLDWGPRLLEVANLGTMVVDNAISHAEETSDFFALIEREIDLQSVVLPIGNGQLVVRRRNR